MKPYFFTGHHKGKKNVISKKYKSVHLCDYYSYFIRIEQNGPYYFISVSADEE